MSTKVLNYLMTNCFHFLFSQLRYQKCLDAHPQGLNPNVSLSNNIISPNVNGISRKGISSTLKSLVGTITGRKMKLTQSWEEVFTLQVENINVEKCMHKTYENIYNSGRTNKSWSAWSNTTSTFAVTTYY